MRIPFTNLDIRLGGSALQRSANTLNPLDDRWYSGSLKYLSSGVEIEPDVAMTYSALFCGVKIISETLASLPLILYKRNGKNKERDTENPLYKLLKARPSQYLHAFNFKEVLTSHYILWGNGYAQIIRDGYGLSPSRLQLIHPSRVRPFIDKDTGVLTYEVQNGPNKFIYLPYWDMFHLVGYSDEGIVGKSLLKYMSETINTGMQMQEYTSNFFANSAAPSGVLKLGPDHGDLDQAAKDRLRVDWKKKFSSPSNAGDVIVLEEGLDWKPIGMPASDSQLIDNRKFNIDDIARFLKVPPHMIGQLDRSTNNNIENQSLGYLKYTMLPHFVRWEQTIQRDLIDPNNKGKEKQFAEFLVAALERGDLQARSSSYAVARQWGWMSANDVREMENMNDIGDKGDVYLTPMNMIDSSKIDEQLPSNQGEIKNPQGQKDPTKDVLINSIVRNADFEAIRESSREMLQNILLRYFKRNEKELHKLSKKNKTSEEFDEHVKELKSLMTTELLPFFRAYFNQSRLKYTIENVDKKSLPIVKDAVVENFTDVTLTELASLKGYDDVDKASREVSDKILTDIDKIVLG